MDRKALSLPFPREGSTQACSLHLGIPLSPIDQAIHPKLSQDIRKDQGAMISSRKNTRVCNIPTQDPSLLRRRNWTLTICLAEFK